MSRCIGSDVDLAAYLSDPESPEWETFRSHFPGCESCASRVAEWTSIEIALRASDQGAASNHPDAEELVQFEESPKALAAERWREIDVHLQSCRTCADEIASLREFDFGALEEAANRGFRGALRRVRKSLRQRERPRPEADQRSEIPSDLLGAGEPAVVLQSRDSERTQQIHTNERARASAGSLVAVEGPLAGETREFPAGESRIGRSRECELRFDEPSLSRVEARIEVGTEGVEIRSLNRRRLVLVNDEPVERAWVRDGDAIQLGALRLGIRLHHASDPAAD